MSNGTGMGDAQVARPSETWIGTTENSVREMRMRVSDFASRLCQLNDRLMGPQPSTIDNQDHAEKAAPHSAMDSMNRESQELNEQVERLGSEVSRLENAGLA